MKDLKKLSGYLQYRIPRRGYTRLLAHGADLLYGPGTSWILISTFGMIGIFLRAFVARLINRGNHLGGTLKLNK